MGGQKWPRHLLDSINIDYQWEFANPLQGAVLPNGCSMCDDGCNVELRLAAYMKFLPNPSY